jgi:hypothetical protein
MEISHGTEMSRIEVISYLLFDEQPDVNCSKYFNNIKKCLKKGNISNFLLRKFHKHFTLQVKLTCL